jgi:cell division septation protein DedD
MMTRRMRSAGLGFGQVFVLVFGFLITSVLIFLFGIWVGRDVTERRLAQEERVVRLSVPVQPTAKEEEKGPDVDLAFYQSLKEKAYQRLQETAAAESATPAHKAQASTPTAPPRRVAEKAKATSTPAVPPKAKRPEPPRIGDEWAGAGWTVQVNATTNAHQATDLAQSLRAKGYDAYTVQAPMRGQTWYRVRVGRFGNHDRDRAKELEARLKNDGFDNAYVTPQ